MCNNFAIRVAAIALFVACVLYLNFTVSKTRARVFGPEKPASRILSASTATQNLLD